jgi:hypothetical protein
MGDDGRSALFSGISDLIGPCEPHPAIAADIKKTTTATTRADFSAGLFSSSTMTLGDVNGAASQLSGS